MGARDPQTKTPYGGFIYEPAPFSLRPTRFGKAAFNKAYGLARPFNHVVHQASSQYSWLKEAVGTAAKGDAEFTGKLVSLADEVLSRGRKQTVVLGILRSDYMLHGDSLESAVPLQVELNTIASSFGCLSAKMTRMHQQLSASSLSSSVNEGPQALPDNNADTGIANGLALALTEYKRQFPGGTTADSNSKPSEVVVVMVVQPGETNSCDQRDLEFVLGARHGVRVLRKSLAELATEAEHIGANDELWLTKEQVRVGVVYFRAGYTPDDYPTNKEWEARAFVEHSAAIKCPDVFYHLFGAKKVQQAIAAPGMLRQFCRSDEEEQTLASSFAGLYALGEGDDSEIVQRALRDPHGFVLKPQREGGGNNLYDDDLVHALKTMSYEERGAFILMQKILPPLTEGQLVRGGKVVYDGKCVCELGVFGISLRDYASDRVLLDNVVGHILRSKSAGTDEGGVAAGYAFLSSPELVE